MTSPIEQNIDPKDIITSKEPSILCVAAAGSGKTYVLTHRIAHLIRDRGVAPESIMALTFTRRAAEDMRKRIADIVTEPVASKIRMGTFHSVCLNLLARVGAPLGVNEDTTVLPPDDVKLIVRHLAALDGLYNKTTRRWKSKWSLKRAMAALEAFYRDEEGDPADTRLASTYVNFCLEHNCIDFGLMLKLTTLLFTRHPEVLAEERKAIRHVVVDEMQDTDAAQYNLHALYAEGADTFFGVGDPRQTIYTWRGARPDLMRARHSDATIMPMSGCRRCTESIVDFANAIIAPLESMLGVQPMTCLRTDGVGKVSLVGSTVETGQWERNIGALASADDLEWRDIAILARKHDTLAAIAEQMGSVPFQLVNGNEDTIYKEDAFLDAYASLRCIVNPKDPVAELVGVELPIDRRGFDPDTKVAEVFALVKTRPGFDWWVKQYGFVSVRAAVHWHSTRDSQTDLRDDNTVKLMTIHAAKGLEWKAVVVANVNEGEIPSKMALRDDPEGHEERRLLYVAATRARDTLRIVYDPANPSRFISGFLR